MFPLFRIKFDIQAFDKSSFVQSVIRSVSQPSKHRCQWALPPQSGRPQDTHSLFLRPDQRPMSFEHLLANFNANLQVATFGNIYIFRLLGLSKWHQIEDVSSWESYLPVLVQQVGGTIAQCPGHIIIHKHKYEPLGSKTAVCSKILYAFFCCYIS